MNDLKGLVARILFGAPFAIFGVLHFMNAENMLSMVPSYVPGGVVWVYLTGLFLLSAGFSIIMQKQAGLAARLLAVLLAVFILSIHLPAVVNGNMIQLPTLLRDIALLGGALSFTNQFEKELS